MLLCLSLVKDWLLLGIVCLITIKALKQESVIQEGLPEEANWDSVVSPRAEDNALIETLLQLYCVVNLLWPILIFSNPPSSSQILASGIFRHFH